MSVQQALQLRASSNGYNRRRLDRETEYRLEKSHSGRLSSNSFGSLGLMNGSKYGRHENSSRDRLVYLAACLIGHPVEVQVKNGSTFSGIFHATNMEKDFGIILKMARLLKDSSINVSKPLPDIFSKHPSKTLIIPAKELVQVIAKDVSLSGDGLANGPVRDKQQDILIDSSISQTCHLEERELERWVPDEDDPQYAELGDIFDGTWNRNWDQFQTNEELFGVKSTFDEELYTTKLERGPNMKELEREALRIAREIEGEATEDLHLAEERGHHLYNDCELNEEARFSSVFRGINHGRCDTSENMNLSSCNTGASGDSSGIALESPFSDSQGEGNDGGQLSSNCSLADELSCRQMDIGISSQASSYTDEFGLTNTDCVSNSALMPDSQTSLLTNDSQSTKCSRDTTEGSDTAKEVESSKQDEIHAPLMKTNLHKGSLSPNATAFIPSSSFCLIASSDRGLSPSSSVGSLSSEKSILNPNAKEFKLNPNAKSYTPPTTLLKPPVPAFEGSLYYPPSIGSVPCMHGLSMGIGVAPFSGHQPVVYSPQAGLPQSSHEYVHTGAPLYGQQVFVGQPRPFFYAPGYPHELQYK